MVRWPDAVVLGQLPTLDKEAMLMQRRIMQELVDWKGRRDRRPLVVRGARQVGKTYLVEQFAREQFQNFVS